MQISPKYHLKLVKQLEGAIVEEYNKESEIRYYISKWANENTSGWGNYDSDFPILTYDSGKLRLNATLHEIPEETLIKMAIELGVETPDFIPAIPTFKNKVKEDYLNARAAFEKAFKEIEEHPDIAIGIANSALEGIIKQILKDKNIRAKIKGSETLYKLTGLVLKEFELYPLSDMPGEIRNIGSGMLKVNQNIEKLRSEKTNLHGSSGDDALIDDSLYAYFVVNSVSTIGMFLDSFYRKKYKPENQETDDDLPF